MQKELEATRSIATTARPQQVSSEVEALNSIPEVEAEYKRAVEVLMWCEDNPDGGELQAPNGETLEITADQVKAMRKVARRNKDMELPARFQYLQQQQASVPTTLQNFPWWSKPESEEYQAAAAIVSEFPEIKRRPDWMHLVGVMVLGLQAFTQRQSQKPAAPIKKAPAQPAQIGRAHV